MAFMDLNGQATRAIGRYRESAWHRTHRGCCRMTPTCSHYAESALRQHSFPVALLLIVWRLLLCNPLTATRRDRQRSVGVLLLAGVTTLMVSWSASATATPRADGSQTVGGCFALVGGHPIGDLSKDHPLQVYKGQKVVIEGQAPAGVAKAVSLDGRMFVTINFIDGIASTDESEITHGAHFSQSANVDSYLKYGSGLYKIDVTAVAAGGWNCSGTFYAEMNGDKLAAEIAVAVGAVGVVGATLASRGDAPDPPVDPSQNNTEPMTSDQMEDKIRQDKILNLGYSSALGCMIAAMALAFKGINVVAPPPLPAKNRIYVKGHTILGFLSGLVAGVGFAIAGQQYAQWTLNMRTAIIFPIACAVLCAARARLGRVWKVSASS